MSKKKAAVIGFPISHSLSPGIFTFLANRMGVADFDYRFEPTDPERLPAMIAQVREQEDFLGLNVTIPHKERVLDLLDEVSPEGQIIGAVNVVHKAEGLLRGYNTDVQGIEATLDKHGYKLRNSSVLLIGSGGAARAIAYVAGKRKAKSVALLNRDRSRAEKLVQEFREIFSETIFQLAGETSNQSETEKIDLVVNATPLGMYGSNQTKLDQTASDFFRSVFSHMNFRFAEGASAFDLIYRPENTLFLKEAHRCGLSTMGGLEMLVEQALQTWKIWFGEKSDVGQHGKDLTDYLRNRPLFLTGFMGAGKSTVGAVLARKLGWKFLDMDVLIEEDQGMTVADIFRKRGEKSFREIESKVVLRNAFTPRSVVALGGGALTVERNTEAVQKLGRLIFLSARPETLLNRLKTPINQRPLLESILANPDLQIQEKKIAELLRERERFYSVAKLQMETDNLTPDEIADRIIEGL